MPDPPLPRCPQLGGVPRRLGAPRLLRSPERLWQRAGLLPLRREVPGRLPPRVASGRGLRQQERGTGGPEEQSGPHDQRLRVSPAPLSSGAARGGGGCRPSPLLLARRGANQRSPSWHAERSRGAGDAGRRGPGTTAKGWEVSRTTERNTKGSSAGQPVPLPEAGAQGGGKDQGPLGAEFSLRPTPPAWVWESAFCEGLRASDRGPGPKETSGTGLAAGLCVPGALPVSKEP